MNLYQGVTKKLTQLYSPNNEVFATVLRKGQGYFPGGEYLAHVMLYINWKAFLICDKRQICVKTVVGLFLAHWYYKPTKFARLRGMCQRHMCTNWGVWFQTCQCGRWAVLLKPTCIKEKVWLPRSSNWQKWLLFEGSWRYPVYCNMYQHLWMCIELPYVNVNVDATDMPLYHGKTTSFDSLQHMVPKENIGLVWLLMTVPAVDIRSSIL